MILIIISVINLNSFLRTLAIYGRIIYDISIYLSASIFPCSSLFCFIIFRMIYQYIQYCCFFILFFPLPPASLTPLLLLLLLFYHNSLNICLLFPALSYLILLLSVSYSSPLYGRALALAVAMMVYGKEESADTLIEQLSKDRGEHY